ncbi:MAG: RNase adaptor protein RapZ [Rhodobacteraceae bacterium GWE1_64_9]|nr:MAG: RNase adaptor protein RapZ [Rhodobacteraceae bacterium GWE1_64_9]OHC48017.1 MAG: RNase adaptor protein RapZ [Rhodobacteraceae bacterium GWF1_65_7]HBD91050.1 RNase adapter RapZ [Gemmobacter sp.]HBU14962.1 RNase adapter RapZ [Gemmobacter sp.]
MDGAPKATPQEHEILLVTGPSGAGRTTAINALEDLGYEPIDNLPLRLIPMLIDGPAAGRPMALGIDVRNRDFNATGLIELVDTLTADPRVTLELLYLDCAPSELIRRYGETRRRHPLAPEEAPALGIERETDLLAPIRVRADHLIDTSEMSPHDLKAEIGQWFRRAGTPGLAVSIQSFSYKRGVPRGLDMIFDCRFLNNPHWVPELRGLDGRDKGVADYVVADSRFPEFDQRLRDLLLFLLPAQKAEGKAHVAIGFGCTGGQHRSVAVAEIMGNALAEAGWTVSKRHRELERRSATARPHGSG